MSVGRFTSTGGGNPDMRGRQPMDETLRRHIHGPVQPMEQPRVGFLRRLFGGQR